MCVIWIGKKKCSGPKSRAASGFGHRKTHRSIFVLTADLKKKKKTRPDIKGRKAIFEVHLTGLNLDGKSTEFSGRLAGLTPGFVGADIENLCNEAAIVAARRDKKKIEMEDFEVRCREEQ